MREEREGIRLAVACLACSAYAGIFSPVREVNEIGETVISLSVRGHEALEPNARVDTGGHDVDTSLHDPKTKLELSFTLRRILTARKHVDRGSPVVIKAENDHLPSQTL